jgi:mRNA-degrading endonuclease RelE of RelBE toxin-antitoxin system
MRFIWPESARAELRAIDRETAIRILRALTQYGESGGGDVKALTGQWQGYYRLRAGDYRIVFAISPHEITVVRVRHRSEAYR